jgi:integrase
VPRVRGYSQVEMCRERFSRSPVAAHSLRAGHVTEALGRGADRAAVKRQTGHASDAMLDRYAREADPFTNNSSGILGL